jgi:hypothetical protein
VGGGALRGHSGRRLQRGRGQRGSPHPGALRGSESGTRSSAEAADFCERNVGGTAHDRRGKVEMWSARSDSGGVVSSRSMRTRARTRLATRRRNRGGRTGGRRRAPRAVAMAGQQRAAGSAGRGLGDAARGSRGRGGGRCGVLVGRLEVRRVGPGQYAQCGFFIYSIFSKLI